MTLLIFTWLRDKTLFWYPYKAQTKEEVNLVKRLLELLYWNVYVQEGIRENKQLGF